MKNERIVLIQGHPDPGGNRFGHALAQAYVRGVRKAGREVRMIDVARLDFPFLRAKEEWESAAAPEAIREVQDTIGWAEHLGIIYPLWLGAMPALLKAFFEQALRPGFAIAKTSGPGMWRKLLGGKSARIVVTMGMPAFVYRWYFGAHSLKNLERNILQFCGIGPVTASLIGMVEGDAGKRAKWLLRLEAFGRDGR